MEEKLYIIHNLPNLYSTRNVISLELVSFFFINKKIISIQSIHIITDICVVQVFLRRSSSKIVVA